MKCFFIDLFKGFKYTVNITNNKRPLNTFSKTIQMNLTKFDSRHPGMKLFQICNVDQPYTMSSVTEQKTITWKINRTQHSRDNERSNKNVGYDCAKKFMPQIWSTNYNAPSLYCINISVWFYKFIHVCQLSKWII